MPESCLQQVEIYLAREGFFIQVQSQSSLGNVPNDR